MNAVYDVPAGEAEGNIDDPNNPVQVDYEWSENHPKASLGATTLSLTTLSLSSPTADEISVVVSVSVEWWPGTGEVRWKGNASATFKLSVTQKKWETGLNIGESKNAQGLVVEGARLTAPQDQRKPLAERDKVWAFPNSVVSCAVETATDSDKWAWRKKDGTAESEGEDDDTIDDPRDYVWTGANFVTGQTTNPDGTVRYLTAPTVSGLTAQALAPASGSFSPKCTISNNRAKPIAASETGTRKDSVLVREAQVTVSTATASLEVHRATAPATDVRPEGSEASGLIGGNSNYAILKLEIGGGSKVGSVSGLLRLFEKADTAHGVSHSSGSNHVDRAINFTNASGWEKRFDPDLVLNADGTTQSNGPKELDWWPSPEAPSAAATKDGGQSYRIKVPWLTTGPMTSQETKIVNGETQTFTSTLLGHNGDHMALLAEVNEVQSNSVSFTLAGGGTIQDEAEENYAVVSLRFVIAELGSQDALKQIKRIYRQTYLDATAAKPSAKGLQALLKLARQTSVLGALRYLKSPQAETLISQGMSARHVDVRGLSSLIAIERFPLLFLKKAQSKNYTSMEWNSLLCRRASFDVAAASCCTCHAFEKRKMSNDNA